MPTLKSKQTGVKIEIELLKFLKQKAKQDGRSLTWLMNDIIRNEQIKTANK